MEIQDALKRWYWTSSRRLGPAKLEKLLRNDLKKLHVATLFVNLGLDTKSTWLGWGKCHSLSWNTCFGCQDHGWRWSDFLWHKASFDRHKIRWKCPLVSFKKHNRTTMQWNSPEISPGVFTNIQWCDWNCYRPFGSLVGTWTYYATFGTNVTLHVSVICINVNCEHFILVTELWAFTGWPLVLKKY